MGNKPISTRTHGIIDYAYGTALIVMPTLLGWRVDAGRLSRSVGLATLASSLMTNYECGLIPVLSMKSHLALDGLETSLLLSAPARLGAADRSAGRILVLFGLVGATVGLLTQTQSSREALPRPAWT